MRKLSHGALYALLYQTGKRMKYAAVIFDMDGTIVDTENIWIEATKQVIVHYGIEYTQDIHTHIRAQVQGMAMHETCLLLKQQFSLSVQVADLIAQKSKIAQDLYQTELSFINGFESFITKLKNNHTNEVAIATNADDITIATTDKALNLTQHFGTHIYGIERVGNQGKPDPAIYLYAADKLGIDPKQCIAIEDSAHGINAAKDAGMYCIGINSSGDRSQLVRADRVIEDYHELDLSDMF